MLARQGFWTHAKHVVGIHTNWKAFGVIGVVHTSFQVCGKGVRPSSPEQISPDFSIQSPPVGHSQLLNQCVEVHAWHGICSHGGTSDHGNSTDMLKRSPDTP